MKGGVPLTSGQEQARRELAELEHLTGGGIKVGRTHECTDERAEIRIDLLVDCLVPEDWRPLVHLNSAEAVYVMVPPAYPFHEPYVYTDHDRFARLPHVLWGHRICLYLSRNDWDPARGMQGLADRLIEWFRCVAEGTLTFGAVVPAPPVTGLSISDVVTVAHELPEALEADAEPWLCWAWVGLVSGSRWEVRRWVTTNDAGPPENGPAFLAVVLGLPEPVGFSFPRQLEDLLAGLQRQRIDIDRLTQRLQLAWEVNNRRYPPNPETGAGPPVMVLVVSPAPLGSAAPSRIAYLAAWLLNGPRLVSRPLTAQDPVWWVPVLDQRPRFTIRRDVSRPASWLHGRRVLLLGCGGLGAPIAEFCVRAGAAQLLMVDNGTVLPGILVRQPYSDADFNRSKVEVLANRLAGVRSGTEITATHGDAVSYVLKGYDPGLDLIIDATAARTVATALERARSEDDRPQPPLLSMTVGHDSARGVATLALSGAGGAGADILRKLAVTAADDDSLLDVLDDFYPDLPRTELFLPEPGCSDPTYVGSAADLASFSAWLLNDALTILGAEPHPARPRRWASVLRAPAAGGWRPTSDRRYWPEDISTRDAEKGYEVRMSPSAFAEIRTYVIRMARLLGSRVETGGLLLGQIDHASRVVWVTEAHGLPEGSEAFTEKLRIDPAAARTAVEERRLLTRQLVQFIGAWHTHPQDAAKPSWEDRTAMQEMTADTGTAALLVILGGKDRDRWRTWTGGRQRPEWYAGLYFPAEPDFSG
jgi:integrative and conjugative element protein (TIGR02256 family)